MSANPDMARGREIRVRSARDLARALRQARKSQGLSQSETSLATGLHRTYLSGLESGRETEMLRRLIRVADTLGLEIVVRPRDIRRGGGVEE